MTMIAAPTENPSHRPMDTNLSGAVDNLTRNCTRKIETMNRTAETVKKRERTPKGHWYWKNLATNTGIYCPTAQENTKHRTARTIFIPSSYSLTLPKSNNSIPFPSTPISKGRLQWAAVIPEYFLNGGRKWAG